MSDQTISPSPVDLAAIRALLDVMNVRPDAEPPCVIDDSTCRDCLNIHASLAIRALLDLCEHQQREIARTGKTPVVKKLRHKWDRATNDTDGHMRWACRYCGVVVRHYNKEPLPPCSQEPR